MPPRAIWSGSITFGLIAIPVKMYTAVGREAPERIDLHLLHETDGQRIRYSRDCEKGHKDLDWDEIVKGYEYGRGKWVEVTDADLDSLDLESLRVIDVVSFAPPEQIDPMLFDSAYYLVPDQAALKAYRLMVQTLQEEGLVGIAKVAIREREHLCTLRASDDLMILDTLRWPEELRDPRFGELGKRQRLSSQERTMARSLIRQLAEDFDPTRFKDEYHKALKKLIQKKIHGEEIVAPQEPAKPAGVEDLMAALRESVNAAKKGYRPKRSTAASSKPSGNGDLKQLSKSELEKRARKLDIPGRSGMDKDELVRAIRRAS